MKKTNVAVPFAFGSSTKRFNYIGLRPQVSLATQGCAAYTLPTKLCRKKRIFEPWTRQLDLDRFTGATEPLKRQRKLERDFGGPGTYVVNEDLFKKKSCSVKDNPSFGESSRFKNKLCTIGPGPGKLNIKPICKKTFSKMMTFEKDGFADRFRTTEPSYRLPPNRYDLRNCGSIEKLMNKKVSHKYGPYELFTQSRDSQVKNHFAGRNFKMPETFYLPMSDMDHLLNDKSKKGYGKFMRTARFGYTYRLKKSILSQRYRDPKEPGPADYDLSHLSCFFKKEQKSQSKKVCFNSSTIKSGFLPWQLSPGPGRYFSIDDKPTPKQSWVFESLMPRIAVFEVKKVNLME